MPRSSRKAGDRCLGPYEDKTKDKPGDEPWFLYSIENGNKEKKSFPTEAAALVAKRGYDAETAAAQAMTVEQGIAHYAAMYLRTRKKNRPASVYATTFRLRFFLARILKLPVAAWTEDVSKELRIGKYRTVPGELEPEVLIHGLATRELRRTKKPATHTSQLNILAAAKTFAGWLVKGKLLKDNPMDWWSLRDEAPPEFGSKGRTKLSFSQAEKVLRLAFDIACRESGKTDMGIRAAVVFVVLMTGLRASTVIGLKVGSLDMRTGEGEDDFWILTAPRAKKRGAIEDVPYGLPEEFHPVLGPLCVGRSTEAPMFMTEPPMSPHLKAALAAKYSALDQAKTPEATKARREFLTEHGTYRQQINKWQRGDFSVDEREAKHHGRDWVRRSVAKICDLAGVPRETAHALRGALTNKLTAKGYADVAQWLLRHLRRSTTDRSYTTPIAATLGKTNQFIGIIKGGRK
jgi:site-specific recombinase XerD